MVIEKPQKVEIQKIDSMVVLIWPGDLMLRNQGLFKPKLLFPLLGIFEAIKSPGF